MAHVVEINQIEHLAYYRMAWRSLLAKTPHANFFQSFDWLEVYWRHFGEKQQLRVLLVFEGDSVAGNKLVGILPLVVRTEIKNLIGTRVLTYPLADWGAFYGPVGPNTTATLLAAMRHITETPRDWDMIDLRWTADGRRAEAAMEQVGLASEQAVWCHSAQVRLSCGWESYWASRTTKWRSNHRRNLRMLADRGAVRYEHYRPAGAAQDDADPRWDLYEHCEQIAARSWQGKSSTGTTLSHNSVRAFLRDVHQVAARVGALDMHVLYVEDRPVAFAYNYHLQGYVGGLRSGFDPAFAAEGAGSVLYMFALEAAALCGDHTYDFGPDYLDVKRHITNHTRTSYCYSHYPSLNVAAQSFRLRRWLKRRRHGDAIGANIAKQCKD
jgi:CelD/BcsL family acetyltransferase involved in cellulose biosynthesis